MTSKTAALLMLYMSLVLFCNLTEHGEGNDAVDERLLIQHKMCAYLPNDLPRINQPTPHGNVIRARFDSLAGSLQSVELTDPIAQARLAFADGDSRFLAVRDTGTYVPGLSKDDYFNFVRPGQTRVMEGTSDVIGDKATERLMDRALDYAIIYNTELLKCISGKK